jgi:hypothetical protein
MILTEVLENLKSDAERKSDVLTNMLAVTPRVENGEIVLATKRKDKIMPLTRRGMLSYLEKINIPAGFFRKCSDELKFNMVSEFHQKTSEKDVFLRMVDDKIRYIASSAYSKFDDIDLINALSDVKGIDLDVKDYLQTEDFFKLRVVTKEPIMPVDKRPFYPGIQIMNSEVGMSSVKIEFLLFEEVCTNGLIVSRAGLPRFSMRHIGKPDSDKVKVGMAKVMHFFPKFVARSRTLLDSMSRWEGDKIKEKIKGQVPEPVMKKIEEFIPNYQQGAETTGLDVLSAYTEAIQSYSLDFRTEHEKLAGDILWGHIAA